MDWFEWKYRANPAGQAQRYKILLDGRLVGAVALLPQRFIWRGRELLGLQAVDGLLGKEIRGKGHFSELMGFLAAQQPAGEPEESFHLSFPSLPASVRAHESAGWNRLASVSLSMCMLTPSLPLEKAGVGLIERVLAFPWAAYRRWLMGPTAGPVRVQEWGEQAIPFDTLNDADRIGGDRSAAFMNWRVKNNPRDDIHVLLVFDREAFQGYAVAKITDRKAHLLELRLRRPRRRHVQALVRHIYQHYRSDAIAFWSLGQPPTDTLIRGMGFIRRELSGECYVKHLDRAGLPGDPDRWAMTYLDSDW